MKRTMREKSAHVDVVHDEDEDDEPELDMVDVRARVLAKGFTEDQLMTTIDEVRRLLLPHHIGRPY